MKYLKSFNEADVTTPNLSSKITKIEVKGYKRYQDIKYGYKEKSLFIQSSPDEKYISFQTGEKGVDISDISEIENIINFLMDEKDKLI